METKITKKPDVLLFNEVTGLEVGAVVNTFRLGARDLKVGDTVGLAMTEGKKGIGEAVVTDVFVGKWDVVRGSAVDNHLYRGQSPHAAQSSLLSALKAIYPDYKPVTDDLSVIYFRRTK